MKKTIILLQVAFAFLVFNKLYGGSLSDVERVKITFSKEQCNYWANVYPSIEDEYISRFGAFPDIVVWENRQEVNIVQWNITYFTSKNNIESSPLWDSPLKWKDIQEIFVVRMQSLKSGEIAYIPVNPSNPEEILDFELSHGIGWKKTVELNLDSININEDEAYKISLEIWKDNPPNGKPIATSDKSYNLVKTTCKTSTDQYCDAYFSGHLTGNPDLCLELLDDFPFTNQLLISLFNHYYEVQNCDSLKWVTSQWLYSLNNELDSLYIQMDIDLITSVADSFSTVKTDKNPGPLTVEIRQKILGMVQEVCGDTLLPPPWHTEE